MALISTLLSAPLLGGFHPPQEPKGSCKAEIPENLQEYKAEILAGLAAAERRKVELGQAWGYPHDRERSYIVGSSGGSLALIEASRVPITTSNDVGQAENCTMVKIWPLVGISAWRHSNGGAWKVWILAKHLDRTGRGAVPLADLQALAADLGIHPKTWRRWLADARRLTLFRDLARPGWILLASHSMAAVVLGCDNVGNRAVEISSRYLFSTGWRSYVWAAYESTHGGRPISRKRQEALAGVPIGTQRRYDKDAGVERHHNYAVSIQSPDELAGIEEFGDRAGPFEFYDRRQHKVVIGWHLPDSRTTTTAETARRGRSRKINKAIGRYNGLFFMEQARSCFAGETPAGKIFHRTRAQAKATERKLARSDHQGLVEIYLWSPEGKKAEIWRPLPQGPTFQDVPMCV
jgi:hypothetical protein